MGGLATQDAHTGRVECRDPHAPAAGADQKGNSIAHLAGGLVGEGDCEDLTRANITSSQQMSDPVRQHSGLARPRPSHDQQWRSLMDYRGTLLRVESFQERLRVTTDRRFAVPIITVRWRLTTRLCPRRHTPGVHLAFGGRAELGQGEVAKKSAHREFQPTSGGREERAAS